MNKLKKQPKKRVKEDWKNNGWPFYLNKILLKENIFEKYKENYGKT